MNAIAPPAAKGKRNTKSTAIGCGCLALVVFAIFGMMSGASGGTKVSVTQKRAELKAFVAKINGDLKYCDADVQNAIAAVSLVANGSLDELTAYDTAKSVTSDCSIMGSNHILDIGTMSLPNGLSGYNLSQVQSDMQVWADSDAVGVGKDIEVLLQNPNNLSAQSDLQSRKSEMESAISDSNSILAACAKKIGLSPAPTISVQGLG